MEVRLNNSRELTLQEQEHLQKLKALVTQALADGTLDKAEMERISGMVQGDKTLTYEELRTIHDTIKEVMGDAVPAVDWS